MSHGKIQLLRYAREARLRRPLRKDHSGGLWLPILLQLPTGGFASDLTGLDVDLVSHAWEDEPGEKALPPPVSLLKWLAGNLREPSDRRIWNDISESARKKRKLLIARDPATIREAIEAIASNPKPRAWYVLEGMSYPDVYLETRNLIVVIEGKRTEGQTTRVTSWMEGRHQMWRHIDRAWEVRGGKPVFGLMIVENPEEAEVFAKETVSDQTIAESLPHRSRIEKAEITRCFLGATSWKTVCNRTGIPLEEIAGITG